MKSTSDQLLANLIAAKKHHERVIYRRYRPDGAHRSHIYDLCRAGWEANHHQGYYYDIPNALRPYVTGGNLTEWWTNISAPGRSRKEVTELLDRAVQHWSAMHHCETYSHQQWAPIRRNPGFMISKNGEVRGPRVEHRKLYAHDDRHPYLSVSLTDRKGHYVHLLVLETFKGPRPEGHWPHWINGDITDNRIENLEWVPYKNRKPDAPQLAA